MSSLPVPGVKNDEQPTLEAKKDITQNIAPESSTTGLSRAKQKKRSRQQIIESLVTEEDKEDKEEKEDKEQKKEEEKIPTKKAKTTTQSEDTEPSLWRGAVVKPLVLAALSALTFAFTTLYRTDVVKKEKKNPETQAAPVGVPQVTIQSKNNFVAGFTP